MILGSKVYCSIEVVLRSACILCKISSIVAGTMLIIYYGFILCLGLVVVTSPLYQLYYSLRFIYINSTIPSIENQSIC